MGKLKELMVKVEEATRYMDDGRTAMYSFKHGWRWTAGGIKYSKRWELEDKDLTRMEVTKRILQGTMTGLESYLVFNMETGDDFDGWLPTLDTNLMVNDSNIILFKYFEKPKSSNSVLLSRTAMPEDSKMRSLSNDLIRRMLNTSKRVSVDKRLEIVYNFAQKLFNSGYKFEQVRKICIAGLKGYEKLLKAIQKPGGRKLHRTSGDSSSARAQKKLTEKNEWFRKQRQENDEPDDKEQDLPEGLKEMKGTKASRGSRKQQVVIKSTSSKDDDTQEGWKTRSVLFVEVTMRGKLAKELREVELRLRGITKYITKIVEGVGK